VKLLSILALLVALSAHALSVKDWEKKSVDDRADYLGTCIVNLTAEISKTDRPLAVKIREWYTVKPPGKTSTDGIYAVFDRLMQLMQQEKDGQADLSKIEVEDVVYSITAAQFKLPPRQAPQELGGFKDMVPAQHAAPPAPAPSSAAKAPPATPPQDADTDFLGPGGFIRPPDLPTGDSGRTVPPPVAPGPKPLMVGKVDVSHFAGLKPGDTEQRVVSLYGQAVVGGGNEKTYGRGALNVNYIDNIISRVDVYRGDLDGARSRAGDDALLDLFGHTEAEAVALLGPPKSRRSMAPALTYLCWAFSMPDRPVGECAGEGTDQTLVLGFRPGSGPFMISVRW
jgi:hypothetical protein